MQFVILENFSVLDLALTFAQSINKLFSLALEKYKSLEFRVLVYLPTWAKNLSCRTPVHLIDPIPAILIHIIFLRSYTFLPVWRKS